jgi:hypothetical protein
LKDNIFIFWKTLRTVLLVSFADKETSRTQLSRRSHLRDSKISLNSTFGSTKCENEEKSNKKRELRVLGNEWEHLIFRKNYVYILAGERLFSKGRKGGKGEKRRD